MKSSCAKWAWMFRIILSAAEVHDPRQLCCRQAHRSRPRRKRQPMPSAAYSNSDALADIKQKRPSPQAVVDAVTGAGGAAILAHPMLMKKCDPHELVRDLADKGIWGIEAFYGAATEGETRLFSSLSREFGLFATCGSDFHGKSRPNAPIGSGWRSCAQLEAALSELCRRFFRT